MSYKGGTEILPQQGEIVRALKFILSAIIVILGVTYFKEGAEYVMGAMPTPWQCDLPGPPASCDGNMIVAELMGLLLYTGAAVVVPTVYAVRQIVLSFKKSPQQSAT